MIKRTWSNTSDNDDNNNNSNNNNNNNDHNNNNIFKKSGIQISSLVQFAYSLSLCKINKPLLCTCISLRIVQEGALLF